jgi:hypothetical protein
LFETGYKKLRGQRLPGRLTKAQPLSPASRSRLSIESSADEANRRAVMAPLQMRFGMQISPARSDDDEEEEFEDADVDSDGTASPPYMLRAGRGAGGGGLVGALRRSLVMCSAGAVGDDDEDGEGEGDGIEIGRPTDVRHVSHVTFDRFGGFLGLPADLEPDVPRPTPSAR